jgi:hypothetical protein
VHIPIVDRNNEKQRNCHFLGLLHGFRGKLEYKEFLRTCHTSIPCILTSYGMHFDRLYVHFTKSTKSGKTLVFELEFTF